MDDSAKSGLVKRIQVRQIQQTMEKAVAESKQQDKAYGEVVIEYLLSLIHISEPTRP